MSLSGLRFLHQPNNGNLKFAGFCDAEGFSKSMSKTIYQLRMFPILYSFLMRLFLPNLNKLNTLMRFESMSWSAL